MDKIFKNFKPKMNSLFGVVADLFIPPLCLACQKRRWKTTPLCLTCNRKLFRALDKDPLEMNREGDPDIKSIFILSQELSKVIHGFKYHHFRRNIFFCMAFVRFIPKTINWVNEFDGLIPIPLSNARKRERGYNQAEEISKILARKSGPKIFKNILLRKSFQGSQTRLSRANREKNLRNAFLINGAHEIQGKRILLVDDVFTTGATTLEAKKVLLEAGCKSVGIFSLARVQKRDGLDDFNLEFEKAFPESKEKKSGG